MTLWLVAVTPTFLPALHQRANHLRADVGLARARRARIGSVVRSRAVTMRMAKSCSVSPGFDREAVGPRSRGG